MKTLFLAVGAAALMAASSAVAQNAGLSATYGSRSADSGFTPDPITVRVDSGGPIDASRTIGGRCVGYIADAPDYEFSYNAGDLPLSFIVDADHDTTLVINGPNGEWYCVDDSDGVDPIYRWGNPQSGTYDVWVGSYSRENGRATLYITELN